MSALGRAAAAILRPRTPSRDADTAVFAVGRADVVMPEALGRVVSWLHALDHPVQLLLLTDRLDVDDVVGRLATDASRPPERDVRELAERLAAGGLVERTLYLSAPAQAAAMTASALADSGLRAERLEGRMVAALRRRLLLSEPMAEVMDALAAAEGTLSGAPSGQQAGAGGDGGRVVAGERTLRRLALPDQLAVYAGHVDGDRGTAVLLYIDGMPRELDTDGLCGALRAPDPVDVCIRLWPLAGDEVIRHLTRRLRDLRSTQALGAESVADVRVATAVADAERLREALYLGQTRLLQVSVSLSARGGDRSEALATAARVRSRLARMGFLPRLAALRQWPALSGMLPGAPDRLGAAHNVTSQAAARLLPLAFAMPQTGGMLLGRDESDHTAVFLDRTRLANPAAIYLGAPGSGKSSLAKMEILRRAARAPADRFLIVDPEGEYGDVVAAVAGGVEMDAAHPVALRLPLLAALRGMGAPALRAARAATLLGPVLGGGDLARTRLARAIDTMLARGDEDLANLPAALGPLDARLADAAARAVAGPLKALVGTDGPPTHVRALSIKLSGVDTALLPALLPALTEAGVGLLTGYGQASGLLWLTLDELHLYLERESGARLLVELAKRARKRGIVLTAVTQHLVDLLRHPDGQALLAACEVVALFRPGIDVLPFAQVLRLDATTCERATLLTPGQALLRAPGRDCLLQVALSPQERAIAETRPGVVRDVVGRKGGDADDGRR